MKTLQAIGLFALLLGFATRAIPAAPQLGSAEKAILEQFQRENPPGPSWFGGTARRVIVTLTPDTPVLHFFGRLNSQHFTQQWCLLPALGKGVRMGLDIDTWLSEEALTEWLLNLDIVESVESGTGSDVLREILKDSVSRGLGNGAPFELAISHITPGLSQAEVGQLMGKPETETLDRWTYSLWFGLHGSTWKVAVDFSAGKVVNTKIEYEGGGLPGLSRSIKAPGTPKAEVKSGWLAPYVLRTTRRFGTSKTESVTWFTPDGQVQRELMSSAEVSIGASAGFVSESRVGGVAKLYATSEDWVLELPDKALGENQWTVLHATSDSHVFVRETGTWGEEPGAGAEIFISGKRAGDIGPFISYKGNTLTMGPDGSLALPVWKDSQKQTTQIVVTGSDGRERFRADLEEFGGVASVLPDGAGVLLESDSGNGLISFIQYGPSGKVRTATIGFNPRIVAWIPGTMMSVIATSVESYRFQLIDWETGRPVWDVADPNRSPVGVSPPSVALIRNYILVSRAEQLPDMATVNRSIYALDVQTGKTVAHWIPDEDAPGGELFTVGSHVYLLSEHDFSEIDADDISAFENGWNPVESAEEPSSK